MLATWRASCPSDIDFWCGFQDNLSPGTRSSTRLVVAVSWRSSLIIGSSIFGSFPFKKLDDLRALGRFDFTDRLVEPNLISEWIHDRKGTVAPPLIGQGSCYLHSTFLHLIVISVYVVDFKINLDRTFGRGYANALRFVRWPRKHHLRAADRYSAEIELAIFTHHSRHVAEAKPVNIEGSRLVNRVHRNHWHQLSVLFHLQFSRVA